MYLMTSVTFNNTKLYITDEDNKLWIDTLLRCIKHKSNRVTNFNIQKINYEPLSLLCKYLPYVLSDIIVEYMAEFINCTCHITCDHNTLCKLSIIIMNYYAFTFTYEKSYIVGIRCDIYRYVSLQDLDYLKFTIDNNQFNATINMTQHELDNISHNKYFSFFNLMLNTIYKKQYDELVIMYMIYNESLKYFKKNET